MLATGSGSAYVFTRERKRWRHVASLAGATGASVALAGDGKTVLAAPSEGQTPAPAFLYVRSGGQWSVRAEALAPSDESGRDDPSFGLGVAVSGDGNTALVGQYGGAWMFIRSGSAWTQEGAELSAPGADRRFGLSVALSADGNTAVVGDPGESGAAGSVFVFTRVNGAWSEQGAGLRPSDAAAPVPDSEGFGEGFGHALAVSGDGSRVVIGDPREGGGVGAAWMFVRTGAAWAQAGPKLLAGGESGRGGFGYSVAISVAGGIAMIGAPNDNDEPHAGAGPQPDTSGAAFAFLPSGGTWAQQGGKLTVDGKGRQVDLGLAVALSANGQTALLGGREGAWPFVLSGSAWSAQGAPLSGEKPFGASLALSGDGNTALVGGVPEYGCGRDMGGPCETSGAATTFARSGSTWTRGASLKGRRGFGSAVALSGDALTALIGSPIAQSGIDSALGGVVLAATLAP